MFTCLIVFCWKKKCLILVKCGQSETDFARVGKIQCEMIFDHHREFKTKTLISGGIREGQRPL